MAFLDIIYSLLLNLIPLGVFAIPLLFLRKKGFGIIYSRIYYGLCLFFLVYWVLPSLFQFTFQEIPSEQNTSMGLQFIFARSLSMVFIYAQYPFIILPFVFVVAPVISLVLLYRRLKEETGGSMAEKFMQLNYSFDKSPREMIFESLKNEDWTREKEIFKAFVILLPISLYLLTVILDIARIDPVNVSESSTALGWFIEILFVYIATFLLSFQLVARSKISYKGRFIGEQMQSKFFSSLSEVGTPIAVLSVILFIAQKTQSMLLVIFFFAYFLMAAFTFIVLLRIFEPISILIFIKLINWWKLKNQPAHKPNFSESSIVAVYALIAAFITMVVIIVVSFILEAMMLNVPDGYDYINQSLAKASPTIDMIILVDLLSSVASLSNIIVVLIYAFFFTRILKMKTSYGVSVLIYSATLLILTIALSPVFYFNLPLLMVADQAWITGSPVNLQLFGFDFYTMRTSFLTSDFSNSRVLQVLAFPFLFLRPFVNFVLFGFLISFIDKRFRIKSIQKEKDSNSFSRMTFSSTDALLTINDFKGNPNYLVTAEDIIFTKNESEDLMGLYNYLKENKGVLIAHLIGKYPDETERLFTMLKYLSSKNYISWWAPEFGYEYERATLDGLYILYSDGRDLFYHNFNKEQGITVEPALVSGMFSAITSFIQETTRTSEKVAAIDSGNKKVILEYSQVFSIFAAIFADRETTDIRLALKNSLLEFEKRHKDVLRNWNGNMDFFKDDEDIIEKNFAEFLK